MAEIVMQDAPVKAYGKGGVLVFEGMLSDFPPHILALGAAYAIHKKAQDASGGKDLTDAAAKEAALAVIANLKAGTWASKASGPRVTTFEAFIAREAAKAAKVLVKPGAQYAGKDEAKVAEALTKHNPWVEKQRKLWDAAQGGVDLVLDI